MKPKILIFQPAWACSEVLEPLKTTLSRAGYEVILVENPPITGNTTLRDIYIKNLEFVRRVIENLHPGQKIVGVGLSQGGHALLKMCDKICLQEHFKSAVVFGTLMLSRRPTMASIRVTLSMVMNRCYHGIFRSIFSNKGSEIVLQRQDVVNFLFGERKPEWEAAIDAVSKQAASSRCLAEMVTGSICRRASNVSVAVVRCSGEVFHSNEGALNWIGMKRYRRPNDSFHLIEGTHFGSLMPGDALKAFSDIILSRCR